MTAFLTIIIVLFIAVAIWQMVKIFDLAQTHPNLDDTAGVATDKDNNINGYLMLGFLVFIYVITIICFVKWGDLPLVSNAASAHGPGIGQFDADFDGCYLFCSNGHTIYSVLVFI